MPVKIITDSACDLPLEITKKYDIDVMPLLVYVDDVEYRDNIDIQPKEFYEKMRNGAETRTAQITSVDFEREFSKYLDYEGDILYIAFSSGLSGTYQTAEIIKNNLKDEHKNLKLHIIDSKCASLGFGLVVYFAAKLAKENKSIEEIIEKVNFYKEHMEHIFTVDDLEYLFKGGRVSRSSYAIGSMFNIKPILDVEDGKLIPIHKIRSRKKAIKKMLEIVGERGVNLENQIVAISHGDDIEKALYIKEELEKKYHPKEFVINNIGPVIGAHSGPGTLSIFFLNQKEE